MSKKFFFVSQVFYPDVVSTAGLFTDLCLEIEEKGTKVEVWCAQPSYTTLKRQPKQVFYKGIKITYIWSTNFRKDILLGRLSNYLTFSVFIFLKLLFSKDKAPIFTVTNPPFLGFLILLIGRIKKRKFVYIVLDVYPDSIIRLGKISDKHIISVIWKKINKSILKNASKILVLGRDMIEWIKTINPGALHKVEYLPHWHDENLIKPMPYEKNPFVKKFNLSDKFVVQYSGNMGLWHDMITFAKITKELESEDIFFIFIGDGLRKKELFEEWNNKVPKNSLVLPYQPKKNLGNSLTACHVALISLRDNLEGMAVPSKLYGILASGIPLVAMVPENSEISFVVNEEKCGYVVNPGDRNELKRRLIELKMNTDLRITMGKNARKAFEQKYTTKRIAQKYIQINNKI